jgi:hypothetical protein
MMQTAPRGYFIIEAPIIIHITDPTTISGANMAMNQRYQLALLRPVASKFGHPHPLLDWRHGAHLHSRNQTIGQAECHQGS